MDANERLKEYFRDNDLTQAQIDELIIIVEQAYEEGYDDAVCICE